MLLNNEVASELKRIIRGRGDLPGGIAVLAINAINNLSLCDEGTSQLLFAVSSL